MWFDSGSMPLRPGALPVPERGVVRHPQPGGLHRRVHRTDPRLVLHAAHPVHRAVRPAGVPERASATASCSAPTARRCPSRLRNYPDVSEVLDRDGSDAMRWFLMSSPDPARRQPGRHRAGHPRRRCARSCCRCGTPGTSSRSTPTPRTRRRRLRGHAALRRLRRHRSTSYLLANTGDLVRDDDRRAWTSYDIAGACERAAQLPGRAHQLVRPPLAASASSTSKPSTPSTRSTPRSRPSAASSRPLLPLVDRGDLARPDRRPLGAPGRLA